MSQLHQVVKVLPGPGAQVEGVAGVVGCNALQLRGSPAHNEDSLHEGGDVTPPVSRHHGHPGPEGRLTADLLLVEDNDGVLVVVVPTETSGHHGHVLTNFSTASIEDTLTRVQFCLSAPHLGPDSHLGKSSSRNSSQDVKSWQTASSYHLGRIFIVVDCQHVRLQLYQVHFKQSDRKWHLSMQPILLVLLYSANRFDCPTKQA